MKTLRIIAKNEKGIAALKQHIAESMKVNFIQRRIRSQTGFNQKVISENPYTLEIWSTPGKPFAYVKTNHLKEEIDTAMLANGATTEDYSYEVEE